MWSKLALLAIAGALGTLSRYGLGSLVMKWCGPGFPWGTFVINSLGCFLFGLVVALVEGKWLSAEAAAVLLTGFMGAFTTFSTFTHDSAELLRTSAWFAAFANIAGQIVLGLLLLIAGMSLGKIFHSGA